MHLNVWIINKKEAFSNCHAPVSHHLTSQSYV